MTQQTPTTKPVNTETKSMTPVLLGILALIMVLLTVMVVFVLGGNKSENNVADKQLSASAAPANSQEIGTKSNDPKQLEFIKSQTRRQADDPRAKGKLDAPVVMVEYGDFSCPMCARYEFTVPEKLQKYIDEGVLRIEWRDMSFFRNHNSQLAAAGSLAAAKQAKFWEYKRAAYALSAQGGHPDWNDELVKETAQKAGVADIDKFMKDYKDPETLKQVDAQTQEAQSAGISGTPFFLINDYFLSGALPAEYFINTIEKAKAEAK